MPAVSIVWLAWGRYGRNDWLGDVPDVVGEHLDVVHGGEQVEERVFGSHSHTKAHR